VRNSKEVIAEIKRLRNKRKISLEELASKVGLAKSTLSRYENGSRDFPVNDINKFAEALNVSVFYLLGIPEWEESIRGTSIPYYDSISAGVAVEIEGMVNKQIATVEIPNRLLGKYSNCNNLFMMKVNGESMNKIIPNESYIIAKQDETFQDGDIVIFSHDGDYALKRYLPNAIDNSILFKAETSDARIKDIVIPINSELETKIYGKVIWYSVALP
jgi:repressor LexA